MITIQTMASFKGAKLSNASYGAFMEAVKALIARGTTEKLGLKAEDFSAFQALLGQLLEATHKSTKDAMTKELDALDQSRDQILTHLFGRIALEADSPDENSKKAGLQLMGLREQYLGLQKKANREETYLIKSFLIETEKTDNAQAFQKLGLKPLLTQLKTVNEQYEQKTASRAEAQAMNALPPTKELRKQLDGYYHAFTTKIGALAIVNPNPELEAFVKSFNKLVKDTRELWKLHIVQLGLWTEEGGREDDEAPSANGGTESGE